MGLVGAPARALTAAEEVSFCSLASGLGELGPSLARGTLLGLVRELELPPLPAVAGPPAAAAYLLDVSTALPERAGGAPALPATPVVVALRVRVALGARVPAVEGLRAGGGAPAGPRLGVAALLEAPTPPGLSTPEERLPLREEREAAELGRLLEVLRVTAGSSRLGGGLARVATLRSMGVHAMPTAVQLSKQPG